MEKINHNSIFWGLKILSILAFSLFLMPLSTASALPSPTFVPGYYNDDGSYTFSNFTWNNPTSGNDTSNPIPQIESISPKSGNINTNTKTITITGNGFIPGSIAKVNNSNRSTIFIDYSHLLVQLNGDEMYQADGFYITVFNGAPGGGYSNAAFFSIDNGIFSNGNQTNNSNGSYGNLASNVIFGTNSFLPSGLIQWVLLAIIIMIIIIIARRIFGGKKSYDESPLKHA